MSDKSNRKTIKDLNLLDSFLFCEATENPENAKLIARIIINRVLGWNIENIHVEAEKQYHGISIGNRGIRLDLQVTEKENGKTVRIYDIEPNVYYEKFLPRRSRYYLSLTDSKFLKTGEEYEALPDYFSIWILPYDPFGDNRMIYTIKNMVVENPELEYNEGVTRVILYTNGAIGGWKELEALLQYFVESIETNAVDDELKKLQSVVDSIKGNEEVGERFMTLGEMIKYEKRDSYEEGRSAGYSEGHDTGYSKGRDAGYTEGHDTGYSEGIVTGFIEVHREMGTSDEKIIELLMTKHSLTREEATARVTDN